MRESVHDFVILRGLGLVGWKLDDIQVHLQLGGKKPSTFIKPQIPLQRMSTLYP
jgi:hypothetical protein